MSKVNIAIVDKQPSNIKYDKQFGLVGMNISVFHLASVPPSGSKLAAKDIDICTNSNPFDPTDYDYVILVGAEPFKKFTGRTGIADYSGRDCSGHKDWEGYNNFIISISPAQLHFKPEMQPVFDKTVKNLHNIIEGTVVVASPGDYKPINDPDKALEYIKMIYTMLPKNTIALDSETSSLYARQGYVLGVSVSHEEKQGVYINSDAMDERVIYWLQRSIDQDSRQVAYHNLKFDIHMYAYHLDISFEKCFKEGRLHDTMLLHYILDERTGTHGLKSLAMKYTDMGDYDFELDQFKTEYCKKHKIKKTEFTYDLIPFDIMWPYAAKDTDATLRLFNFFYPKVMNNPKFKNLYEALIMPACRFLQKVEERGVPINKDRLKLTHRILTDKLNKYISDLYEFEEVVEYERGRGDKFNPGSVKQLRELLFDVLGLEPTGALTGTGEISTDAEALEELSEQHPIAETLLQIRKTTKLISTYVEKLLLSIDSDGRVRTGFHLHTTSSGRLSSSGKLNLQQLPRDESIIKGCISAPPGYRIIAHDLTTAEIYFAAVMSGDKNMQQVFINMQNDPERYSDFHSSIAHMVFRLACDPNLVSSLHPALRQAAKAISFGILYGSGPSKVAEAVNEALQKQFLETGIPYEPCTTSQAKDYINTYFDQFPELKRWIEESHNQIEQNGFIYSPFGRKRRLPNINSDDRSVRGAEVRSGFNAGIQSASSDTLLIGVIDADNEIESLGLSKEMEIIMLVHDSVVAIVREDLVDQYNEIIVRNIQKDRGISIKDCPVGVASDSEEGGSYDYSCGKVKAQHPAIAAIGDISYRQGIKQDISNMVDPEYTLRVLDSGKKHPEYAKVSELFPTLAKSTKCKDLLGEWNYMIENSFPEYSSLKVAA